MTALTVFRPTCAVCLKLCRLKCVLLLSTCSTNMTWLGLTLIRLQKILGDSDSKGSWLWLNSDDSGTARWYVLLEKFMTEHAKAAERKYCNSLAWGASDCSYCKCSHCWFFFTRSVFFLFHLGFWGFIKNLGFFDSGQILEMYLYYCIFHPRIQ